MLNLRIAICDDDKIYRENITSFLSSYLVARDDNFTYAEFASGEELLKSFRHPGDFHILFLDIEMSVMDGLKTAEHIKSAIDSHVFIVFISNYPQYMQDSFRVHPYYYLVKPITRERLFSIMDEIVREINSQHLFYTIIQKDEEEKKEVTIDIRDIRYIDVADGNRGILRFHFFDETIQARGTLADWAEKLKDYHFISCYRGVLLNLAFIHYFKKHSVMLDSGETVPLSRSCEKELRQTFLNHIVDLKKL